MFWQFVSARWRIFAPIAIAVVLIVLAVAFGLGASYGRSWADSEYLQEREERMNRIAVHEAKEKELALENERLKLENESKAEILRETDTANEARRAEEFQRLQDERKAKGEEIENATPAENLSGLCDDARKAGLKLSFCE
jgi:hypothetical protein